MNFTFKNKNFKKKLKPFTNKNKLKLNNITLKGILLQIIISLLFSLKIIILKIK